MPGAFINGSYVSFFVYNSSKTKRQGVSNLLSLDVYLGYVSLCIIVVSMIEYFLHRYNITTDDGPREFTAEENHK